MDLLKLFRRKNGLNGKAWKVDPSKYKGHSFDGMRFSGNSIKYPIANRMKRVVDGWPFYTGVHPDGTGLEMLRCAKCHNGFVPTSEGLVIHLIQAHNYTREGTINE